LADPGQADIHQLRSLGLALSQTAGERPESLIGDLFAAGVAILGGAAVSQGAFATTLYLYIWSDRGEIESNRSAALGVLILW
jgi:hypothetical protein